VKQAEGFRRTTVVLVRFRHAVGKIKMAMINPMIEWNLRRLLFS
jgi:hypothetical protein